MVYIIPEKINQKFLKKKPADIETEKFSVSFQFLFQIFKTAVPVKF